MAGHSHASNVKHRKNANDSKRSASFTKLLRGVYVAAKAGMPDIDANPMLRSATYLARKGGVPNDRILAAIKKASGSNSSDETYEYVQYEGYANGGVAVIINALTDNRTRTASDLRHTFSKNGGNLGESGNVSYLFEHNGVIIYNKKSLGNSIEKFMESAIEHDIIDIINNDEDSDSDILIYTTIPNFNNVKESLYKEFGESDRAELRFIPQMKTEISSTEAFEKFIKLIEIIENNDDVQSVDHNAEYTGE
ncbi:MAG: YebC/PmpR family DNA-binding transcriptional regulator [Anaplasmataceae bacterium]|nr:YebC/PmpR family DNA-binding transcriptional regulator [Anaplasmataceae bacterium]